MKQAVILAAGRGSRLNGASEGIPKCLVEVGGAELVAHQLDVLSQVGVSRACAVVGFRGDDVRKVVGGRCDLIVNDRFAVTNSLYSLWLARAWVDGPFVLINCDVLAHPDVYHRVLAVNGNALAYDSGSGDDEEHMKVAVRGGLVQALGKTLPADRVDGENVGILQFDEAAAAILFEEADRLIRAGGQRHWAPKAVDRAARRVPIRAVEVGDLPWTEIDFPADLECAVREVWPRIERGRRLASGRTAKLHG